jgi:hypothetical protein
LWPSFGPQVGCLAQSQIYRDKKVDNVCFIISNKTNQKLARLCGKEIF